MLFRIKYVGFFIQKASIIIYLMIDASCIDLENNDFRIFQFLRDPH